MPTGYTEKVRSGEVTDFKKFAMTCARAFGATIMMRDDPADAEIPESFLPSPYHRDAIERVRVRLAELAGYDAAKKEEGARAEYMAGMRVHLDSEARKIEERARYEEMLAKVKAWVPPGEDHIQFKDFMVSQLQESIQWDCEFENSSPTRLSGDEWFEGAMTRATRDLAYHTKEWENELKRTEERNKWVGDLRNSL